MLNNLDDIPWSSLLHAYGEASDVPGQIRALASQDKQEREDALWELYGNIFHQGTRYQATPMAIPFLFELLDREDTPDRHEIVYLLVSLALGYEEYYLPAGIDPEALRSETARSESSLSPEERAECDRYGFSPQASLDSYEAVRQGVASFLTSIESKDSLLSRAAIYALAWFPEHAESSLAAIRAKIPQLSDPVCLANALLSLGLLWRSTGTPSDSALRDGFLDHESLVVRAATAIAYAGEQMDDETVAGLIETLKETESLQSLEALRFNEGRLSGYAGLTLALFGHDQRSTAVPALCKALEGVGAYAALDIAEALLKLTIVDTEKPITETPAHALDSLTGMALHAIADHGGWKLSGGEFVNFGELMRAYGLPGNRKEFQEYVKT